MLIKGVPPGRQRPIDDRRAGPRPLKIRTCRRRRRPFGGYNPQPWPSWRSRRFSRSRPVAQAPTDGGSRFRSSSWRRFWDSLRSSRTTGAHMGERTATDSHHCLSGALQVNWGALEIMSHLTRPVWTPAGRRAAHTRRSTSLVVRRSAPGDARRGSHVQVGVREVVSQRVRPAGRCDRGPHPGPAGPHRARHAEPDP